MNMPNAVWHWTQGTLKVWIFRVNDEYQYRIYETAHGMLKQLTTATEPTLALAKQGAFTQLKELGL